jgi:hypothetical protein
MTEKKKEYIVSKGRVIDDLPFIPCLCNCIRICPMDHLKATVMTKNEQNNTIICGKVGQSLSSDIREYPILPPELTSKSWQSPYQTPIAAVPLTN